MPNVQLTDYIKQQTASGVSKDVIYHNLISPAGGGWDHTDINEAFRNLGIETIVQPPQNIKYAGFWIRFVANWIDGFVTSFIALPFFFTVSVLLSLSPLKSNEQITTIISICSIVVNLLIIALYYSLMTYYKGATLGKMSVGLVVKNENLEPLSFGKIILRETIGKILSTIILCVGFFMAGFTKKKQTLHDKLVGSIVIYKNPSKSTNSGIIIIFAIIFLFVGIAVIGILSSVVLASLNSARQKGQDASIKSNLASIVSNVHLYEYDNNSYSEALDCNSGVFLDSNIQNSIKSITTDNSTGKSIKNVTCYAHKSTFAISADLNNSKNFCFDNTGYNSFGKAVDENGSARCVPEQDSAIPSNEISQPQATGEIANSSNYSYSLPAGWEKNGTSTKGVLSYNKTKNYVFVEDEIVIPTSEGKVDSVTDVINSKDIESRIKSEFPNNKNIITTEGTIINKKALITTFEAMNNKSKLIFFKQYNFVHKNIFYTFIFMSPFEQKQVAVFDFDSIVASVNFK